MALVEDFSAFFADFSVTAVAGASSAKVIFDAPDENILGDRVSTRRYSITYQAGTLGAIAYGSTVVVNGTTYRVLEVNAIDDGALERAVLEKP